jgi:predicted HTH domain antitoxin
MGVTFDIPEDVLASLPGSASEAQERLRLELACGLYQSELASFGSAARVAGLHPFIFGHELTRRGIDRHYGEAEMGDDAAYVAGRQ